MTADAAAEALLRRDRAVLIAGLLVLGALSWTWLLRGAGKEMTAWEMSRAALFPHLGADAPMSMEPGSMPMEQGAMDAVGWSVGRAAMMVAMWWVMMIAMMLPSVAPMVLLHARAVRHGQRRGRIAPGPVPTVWFLAGYLLVWLGFSLAAVALQWLLERSGALSGTMLWSQSRWLSAGVLAAAALYQFSPLKGMCLAHCQAPAEYLSTHWRPGAIGALGMGIGHGAYCVGCCWALMALLFVGGVMNLVWIAALAAFVLAEKLLPAGQAVSRIAALVLAVWAVATFLV